MLEEFLQGLGAISPAKSPASIGQGSATSKRIRAREPGSDGDGDQACPHMQQALGDRLRDEELEKAKHALREKDVLLREQDNNLRWHCSRSQYEIAELKGDEADLRAEIAAHKAAAAAGGSRRELERIIFSSIHENLVSAISSTNPSPRSQSSEATRPTCAPR